MIDKNGLGQQDQESQNGVAQRAAPESWTSFTPWKTEINLRERTFLLILLTGTEHVMMWNVNEPYLKYLNISVEALVLSLRRRRIDGCNKM